MTTPASNWGPQSRETVTWARGGWWGTSAQRWWLGDELSIHRPRCGCDFFVRPAVDNRRSWGESLPLFNNQDMGL